MVIIVAITGASGSIYAQRLIERLCGDDGVSKVYVVFSDSGRQVFEFEVGELAGHAKVELLAVDNLFAAIASGSAAASAMVVVPCSMGTMGRIAGGISSNLIERAADVMLKERLPLIIVARETPLSLIHLNSMTTLTQAGAIILPACPSFYLHPQTIDDLVDTVVNRILRLLTITTTQSNWQLAVDN